MNWFGRRRMSPAPSPPPSPPPPDPAAQADMNAREQEAIKEFAALCKRLNVRPEFRQLVINGQPGPAQMVFVALAQSPQQGAAETVPAS